MSEEEIKKIAREEMLDTIKSKLNSSLIFIYINNLEKEHQALLDIKELLLNEEQPIQPGYIRYDILEIIEKVLGDKENEWRN